jgi:hypothetical protein
LWLNVLSITVVVIGGTWGTGLLNNFDLWVAVWGTKFAAMSIESQSSLRSSVTCGDIYLFISSFDTLLTWISSILIGDYLCDSVEGCVGGWPANILISLCSVLKKFSFLFSNIDYLSFFLNESLAFLWRDPWLLTPALAVPGLYR